MNEIVPFHGNAVTLATDGRLDVRAMMQHFTAPYRAAAPFHDVIQTIKLNSTPEIRRCKNRRPGAAIAIRKAVAGHIDAVVRARDRLSVVMLAPDEPEVRLIIGTMFAAFHAPPTPTSEYFIDTLVMELMEPEAGQPFCLPAIAAAAREMWQTLPAPPSIADFVPCVEKHQNRIESVLRQLGYTLEAAEWADDLIKPEKVWDEDDPDFIPF
jgi:hypothetical protein